MKNKKTTECEVCKASVCSIHSNGHAYIKGAHQADCPECKAPPEPVEEWQPAWEKLKCKTTSASIIGFENDADIKFIRNLLAQERERQKKIDVDICLYEYLESIKKDCAKAYNLGWHDAAFTIRKKIIRS